MKQISAAFQKICTIALAVGLSLAVAGVLMGGSLEFFDLSSHSFTKELLQSDLLTKQNKTSTTVVTSSASQPYAQELAPVPVGENFPLSAQELQGVTSLSVNCTAQQLTIMGGDAYAVINHGESNKGFSMYVTGDTLYIEADELLHNSENLTITVPSDKCFEEIEIEVATGTLNINDVNCDDAEISVGAGEILIDQFTVLQEVELNVGLGNAKISGVFKGDVEIECGLGSVTFDVFGCQNYGYDIDKALGNVLIDGTSFSGIANERTYNTDADTVFTVDCGLGSVSIYFN